MKKILAMLMVVAMVCGICGTAFASEKAVDFGSYTDDELLELSAMLNSELESRGLTDKKVNELPSGTYRVGTDIPAGSYTFWQIPEDDYTAVLRVYANIDDEDDITSGSADEKGCMLNLEDGQILKITWTGVMASKFSADSMEW